MWDTAWHTVDRGRELYTWSVNSRATTKEREREETVASAVVEDEEEAEDILIHIHTESG